MICEGQTYLVFKVDDHLWIMISDPSQDPDHIVVVRMLSETESTEDDCMLDVGDHPFIKHRTSINYTDAADIGTGALARLEAAGSLKYRGPVTPAALAKIRAAASGSDLPFKYVELLRQQKLL